MVRRVCSGFQVSELPWPILRLKGLHVEACNYLSCRAKTRTPRALGYLTGRYPSVLQDIVRHGFYITWTARALSPIWFFARPPAPEGDMPKASSLRWNHKTCKAQNPLNNAKGATRNVIFYSSLQGPYCKPSAAHMPPGTA